MVLAAGCGSDEAAAPATTAPAKQSVTTTAAPATTEQPSSAPIRIALVAPSASNDLAFTQSMVDALAAVGENRSIEVDVTDGTFIVEDAAAAVRGYAEDGYDLVIAHGSQYGGPLAEIAPGYPDVSYHLRPRSLQAQEGPPL